MHLVFGIVEVLTLLDVLASQSWNPNFYPTKTGLEFPHPFQQYAYNNYVTQFPYKVVNPNFQAEYRSGGIFNGQGLMRAQNPYEISPNFEKSNNQLVKGVEEKLFGTGRIGNGENYINKFGPVPYFPYAGNSMVFVRDQQQEFPIFQDSNGISEASKSINNVPFFKSAEYKLNAPGEQINNANTFGQQNFQGNGWEWKQNSQVWPQFSNSAANLYKPFRNDNEKISSSSFPVPYSDGYVTSANGGGPNVSQYVPTFIPTQRNDNKNEFNKYGSQPVNANFDTYENNPLSQRKLEGFGPLIKPFQYQRGFLPLFSENPTTLQTIPKNKNIEQYNLNLLADASSRNFLFEPTTGNANNFIRNNQVPWPSQSNVQYDFNLINQASTAEDLFNNEIKNIDLLMGKPYLHRKQSFPLLSDSPNFPDYSFKMRDEQLYKSFIGANENGFPLKRQVKNGNFPSNEKIIKAFDREHNLPSFREYRQKFDQNDALNSQAYLTEEFQQEFGKSDDTEKENAYMGNKLLLSSANEAAEKKLSVNDRLNTALKGLDDRKDWNTANFEPFKNTVGESVYGPKLYQKRMTTQDRQTNKWDPFSEDGQQENEIAFEEEPLLRSSEFSPTSQMHDNLKEVEESIPVNVPDSYTPAPFMEQIRMLKAGSGEYLMQKKSYYFNSTEVKNFNAEITIDTLISIILSAQEDYSTIVVINQTIFDEIIEFLSATQGEKQPVMPWESEEVTQTADSPGIKVVTEYMIMKNSKIIDENDKNLSENEKEYLTDPTRVSGEERYAVGDPKNEEVA